MATIIEQTGHGYKTGFIIKIYPDPALFPPNPGDYGIWEITEIDSNNYELTTLLESVPSGGYTPQATDLVLARLQSEHCSFNPTTVTNYLQNCYAHLISCLTLGGITTPKVQFGEVLHWFFNDGSSMAFYDAWQYDTFMASYGRPLHFFVGPNDDPSVNSYEDANFLYTVLRDHCEAIKAYVLATYPNTVFEWLLPNDVCYYMSYTNSTYPYFLGGPLNKYVNQPPQWNNDTDTMNYILMEALAFGTSFRSLGPAKESMRFAQVTPFSWPLNKTKYLIPWQNGGCPWQVEFLNAVKLGLITVVFWAADHSSLFHRGHYLPMRDGYSDE